MLTIDAYGNTTNQQLLGHHSGRDIDQIGFQVKFATAGL